MTGLWWCFWDRTWCPSWLMCCCRVEQYVGVGLSSPAFASCLPHGRMSHLAEGSAPPGLRFGRSVVQLCEGGYLLTFLSVRSDVIPPLPHVRIAPESLFHWFDLQTDTMFPHPRQSFLITRRADPFRNGTLCVFVLSLRVAVVRQDKVSDLEINQIKPNPSWVQTVSGSHCVCCVHSRLFSLPPLSKYVCEVKL